MNCNEARNKMFDFCEQFGAGTVLPKQLAEHIAGCDNCDIFYEHIIHDGFAQIEREKQSELNPYLANKILLKSSRQGERVFERKLFFKTPMYVTSVLLAGILTGVALMDLTPTETDTTDEQIAQTDVATTDTDATTSTDNSTLTLNDW